MIKKEVSCDEEENDVKKIIVFLGYLHEWIKFSNRIKE